MSPDDTRHIPGLLSAVAALQKGEEHGVREAEALRGEIHASEHRLLDAVHDVDKECREFRNEVRAAWEQSRREQAQRDKEERERKEAEDAKSGQRSTALILATIAMVGVLAQSAASIIGALT